MSRALAPCGTPAAYRRHQRRHEKICRDCKDWYNAWRQQARAAARQGGTGHLILVPGVIEPAGLCDCPMNEAHWASQDVS